jgi:Ras of Complex, Roc, domain of DAPkinase
MSAGNVKRSGQAQNRLRVLVVGEAGVGKTTLISSLCGAHDDRHDHSTVGCVVSVRVGARGVVEEFYDVCGRTRFGHGRHVFFRATDYDALLLVHDLSERPTRAALSRVWVPETMGVLGDIKAVDAGRRRESAAAHVRVDSVLDELRVLWLHCRSKHAGLNPFDAAREAIRLSLRLLRLVLNEYDVWTDEQIDREAELELLSSSTVPVAIIGLKKDTIRPRSLAAPMSESMSAVSASAEGCSFEHVQSNNEVATLISLSAFDAADDPSLGAFLRRAADYSRRKTVAGESADPLDTAYMSLSF